MRDLIVLVADRNAEYAVIGAMCRPDALDTRPIDFRILSHPGHDGGVRKNGADLLRLQQGSYDHALMLLDYEGCGSDDNALAVEGALDQRLVVDWGAGRAKSIVIEPEIDGWMWGAEVHLRDVLNWNFTEGVRDWLMSAGFEFDDLQKPKRPKEALMAACKRTQTARSSSHYKALAERLSLPRCKDASFQRLRQTLVTWFPKTTASA